MYRKSKNNDPEREKKEKRKRRETRRRNPYAKGEDECTGGPSVGSGWKGQGLGPSTRVPAKEFYDIYLQGQCFSRKLKD